MTKLYAVMASVMVMSVAMHAQPWGRAVVRPFVRLVMSSQRNLSPGTSSLNRAVSAGNAEAVKELLAAGVSPNPQVHAPNHHWSALQRAVYQGNVEIVSLLLDAGADINWVNAEGQTALHIATYNMRVDIAKLLIIQAHLDAWKAIEDGNTSTRPLLVSKTIDACDSRGYTPLGIALRREDVTMASLLLHSGADIHAKGQHGLSALDLIRQAGNKHTESVQLVLAHYERNNIPKPI